MTPTPSLSFPGLIGTLMLLTGGCQAAATGDITPPDTKGQPTLLVLEVETLDVHHPVPILVAKVDTPPEEALKTDHSVDVALGDDYPATVTMVFDNAYGRCLDMYGEDGVGFVIDEMVPRLGSGPLGAKMLGSDSLAIAPTQAGVFTIDLSGSVALGAECAAKEGLALNRPFEIALTVRVFVPTATQVVLPEVCTLSARPQLESPAVFDTFVSDLWALAVFDAAGEQYRPINASRPRPVGLTIEASPGLKIALVEPNESTAKRLDGAKVGLSGLVATGRGTLTIRMATGEVLTMDVGDASDITAFVSTFGLTSVKGGGEPLPEVDTFIVPDPGNTTRTMALMVTQQQAGPNTFCTTPSVGNYTVESLTPDVCPTVDGPPTGDVKAPVFQTSAQLDKDGRCQLEVTGPSGTEPDLFDMTFEGVERLGDPWPLW